MVTSNVSIYFTIMFYIYSVQSLNEVSNNGHIEVIANFIDQIIAKNDSKLHEFLDIFHYFVNLTVLENERRADIHNLTTSISDNETKILFKDDGNSTALAKVINDVMKEENITADLNQTHIEDVTDYIKTFVNKPENLKEEYIQNMHSYTNGEEKEVVANESNAAEDFGYYSGKNKEENGFWDITATRRIYGGNSTKIKYFPFIASVHMLNQFVCAGSIISADLIITAASCLQLAWNNRFFRENPAFISVRVGSPYYSFGGELIPILEVYFHPTYVPKTLYNNLALMRLQRRLKFSRRQRNVKKIDIDRSESALPVTTPGITIVGWGAKSVSNIMNPMSTKLDMAVLDFYDLESCREIYGKMFVTKTNFCAGFITKGHGACNHDVGDPGVSGRLLVGVTSFGSPTCGRADTPTVYTKVGYYADWIEDIMDQEVPRIKVRTTTRRSSKHNAPIILYGKHLRDYTAKHLHDTLISDEDEQQIVDMTDSDESMIPPILKSETLTPLPEILLRDTQQTTRRPELNTPEIIRIPQEEKLNYEDDKDLSENSENDFSTGTPALTKIIDYDPNESRETNIHHVAKTAEPFEIDNMGTTISESSESVNLNVQEVVERSKSAETENLQASLSEYSDYSTNEPGTNIENNNPAKSISSETDANTEDEEIGMLDPFENYNHGASNVHRKDDIQSDSAVMVPTEKHKLTTARDEVIDMLDPFESYNNHASNVHRGGVQSGSGVMHPTGKYEKSTVDDDSNSLMEETFLSKEVRKQNEVENLSTTQNINDNGFTKFMDAENNIEDENDSLDLPGNTDDIEYQTLAEVGPELTEYMLKREIDKLIKQLEISSEVNAVTVDDLLTANTQFVQDTFNHNDKNKANLGTAQLHGASTREEEAVKNLEALSSPNKGKDLKGTGTDASAEEGLSIDPEPFESAVKTVNNYDLMRRKEIYDIFADVLRTVVNKTSG